ncbi:MAG TPA: chaperone modulator CbpM [Ktedonobacteraceae bacterium]|nr:chaperone modulator CbpM [Ktedonobacteraceae bacterium]
MAETRGTYTRIIIQSSRPASYYSEQETALYSHLDVAVIRELQAEGLIHGVEIVGEGVRYSDEDVAILRRIRRLQQDLGLNIEGVEVVLNLLANLQSLQQELTEQHRHHQSILANPNTTLTGDGSSS